MSKQEWFRSWFDSPYYPILYRNRDFSEAQQFIDALLAFLNPKPSDTFLDVACGRGRHSIYLNSLGYNVTGIDISANSIEDAQQSASESLSFHVHDMREPLAENEYEIALNLFTSFGYFETREEHLKSLENIYKSLKPGGTFVIDFLNTEYVQSGLVPSEKDEASNVKFEITRTLANGYIEKNIHVTDGDKASVFQEKVMAFSRAELDEMLGKAGFTIQRCFGDYKLAPTSPSAPRTIIIASKAL